MQADLEKWKRTFGLRKPEEAQTMKKHAQEAASDGTEVSSLRVEPN